MKIAYDWPLTETTNFITTSPVVTSTANNNNKHGKFWWAKDPTKLYNSYSELLNQKNTIEATVSQAPKKISTAAPSLESVYQNQIWWDPGHIKSRTTATPTTSTNLLHKRNDIIGVNSAREDEIWWSPGWGHTSTQSSKDSCKKITATLIFSSSYFACLTTLRVAIYFKVTLWVI